MRSSSPSRPDADPIRPSSLLTAAAAVSVSLAAFALYRATLLPGVDFGDSGSIQTVAGSSLVTPRDGYPLYFAIGDVVVWLAGGGAAHAMNLVSAIEAAIACGLFVLVGVEITGSVAAATAGAALFGVSYTFWSQSVTAEVYALHVSLILASLSLLLRWSRRPTMARLAAFFACYAIAFGNHLSMILLAPGIVVFLFLSEPRGWRRLMSGPVVGLAVAIALLGSLQYLWNLHTLWALSDSPPTLSTAIQTFWFDVTKSDWRDTMVLNVPRSMLSDHLAMYWFDLRQQFGLAPVLLAAAGAVFLAIRRPRVAALLVLVYGANVAFAFSYNVGDAHVFYIPSHLVLALLATAGLAAIGGATRSFGQRDWTAAAAALLFGYAAARGTRDYPALDRSSDDRAAKWLESLTRGLDERDQVLLVDLNWQQANGLSYFTKAVAPHILVARMRDVLFYLPALVADNLAAGREIVVNPQAGRLMAQSYQPLFERATDTTVPSLADQARLAPKGSRYVICVLKPTRDFATDTADLQAAIRSLTGGRDVTIPYDAYAAIAGLVGEPPTNVLSGDRPFTQTIDMTGTPVEIRMEAWLAADTIRRMGFGHVIAAHRHTLIVERGISLAVFAADGKALLQAYDANLFAALPRDLVRAANPLLVPDVLR